MMFLKAAPDSFDSTEKNTFIGIERFCTGIWADVSSLKITYNVIFSGQVDSHSLESSICVVDQEFFKTVWNVW